MKFSKYVIPAFLALFLLGGCDEGPAESAGEDIDEAVEETGEGIDEAGDETEDAFD